MSRPLNLLTLTPFVVAATGCNVIPGLSELTGAGHADYPEVAKSQCHATSKGHVLFVSEGGDAIGAAMNEPSGRCDQLAQISSWSPGDTLIGVFAFRDNPRKLLDEQGGGDDSSFVVKVSLGDLEHQRVQWFSTMPNHWMSEPVYIFEEQKHYAIFDNPQHGVMATFRALVLEHEEQVLAMGGSTVDLKVSVHLNRGTTEDLQPVEPALAEGTIEARLDGEALTKWINEPGMLGARDVKKGKLHTDEMAAQARDYYLRIVEKRRVLDEASIQEVYVTPNSWHIERNSLGVILHRSAGARVRGKKDGACWEQSFVFKFEYDGQGYQSDPSGIRTTNERRVTCASLM